MRTEEKRFNGFGNGPRGGWQIICHRCGSASKNYAGKSTSLPPKVVLNKLRQAGWEVGKSALHDVCPECARKPIASHAAVASKAVHELMAPMVKLDEHRSVHFSELVAAVPKLDPEQARELIKLLRERLPRPQPRQPRPTVEREPEDEYMKWLETL